MSKFRNSRKKQKGPALDKLIGDVKMVHLVAIAWAMFAIDLSADETEAVKAVSNGVATAEDEWLFARVKARRTQTIEGTFDKIYPDWRRLLKSEITDETILSVFVL